MSEEEYTFEYWSYMWDRIFDVCIKLNDFRALISHMLKYKQRWNYGRL
jgi:hypothetical protein